MRVVPISPVPLALRPPAAPPPHLGVQVVGGRVVAVPKGLVALHQATASHLLDAIEAGAAFNQLEHSLAGARRSQAQPQPTWLRNISLVLYAAWQAASGAPDAPPAGAAAGAGDTAIGDGGTGAAGGRCSCSTRDGAAPEAGDLLVERGRDGVGCAPLRRGGRRAVLPTVAEKPGLEGFVPVVALPRSPRHAKPGCCCVCAADCCGCCSRSGSGAVGGIPAADGAAPQPAGSAFCCGDSELCQPRCRARCGALPPNTKPSPGGAPAALPLNSNWKARDPVCAADGPAAVVASESAGWLAAAEPGTASAAGLPATHGSTECSPEAQAGAG